ncbi:MAG: hypothetical protein KAS72_15715 [Phycisphaerales bacterium]|nr:hypothetical protein [Phycisphaerales bacterium]
MPMDPTTDVIETCQAEPIITADDREHPTLVLVRWFPAVTLTWALQIYVDGNLCDVVTRRGTDRLVLRIDRGESAVIELIAVDALDPWAVRPDELSGFLAPPNRRVVVESFRDPTGLSPEMQLGIEVDDVLVDVAPIWPSDAARPGFGLVFGEEDFGVGMTVGPGFGNTEQGCGPFGCGGSVLRRAIHVPAGADCDISVVLIDGGGSVVSSEAISAECELYAVTPAPSPAEPSDDDFTITWTLPSS